MSMGRWIMRISALWLCFCLALPAAAQDADGTYWIGTVERPPFSMTSPDGQTGFSIELWDKLAEDVGIEYRIRRFLTFRAMLNAVRDGEVDAAVANISITEERETEMDFSQPIFESGLQIMLRGETNGTWQLLRSVMTPRLLLAVLFFFAVTWIIGIIMWALERRKHDYFGKSLRDASFPAFWWALNLIISNGYEEEMPRSRLGRAFGTIMVICSLFMVSFFTANITASLTVNAITEDVSNISDLDGLRVGTTRGSTTSTFLDLRGITHRQYDTLNTVLAAFENNEIDAVVFDGPVLAYYIQTEQPQDARLIDRLFRREGYGFALPSGSELREPIDRALLRAREDGSYDQIKTDWFGATYSDK